MKKLSDITSKFKNTKFRVQMTVKAATDVQKAMHSMGFRCYNSESGSERNATGRSTMGGIAHAFYIDADLRYTSTTHSGAFSRKQGYDEIPTLEVFEAAAEFKLLKVALRKQRKAEKLAEAGWIYAATPCEVPRGVALNIVFDDKSTLDNWTFNDYAHYITPLRYQLVKPKPATISLFDMVQGIVMDAGGKEVVPESPLDADGFIVWAGGICPVEKGTLVDVKYRDGEVKLGLPAQATAAVVPYTSTRTAIGNFWANDGYRNDIVAYRVAVPKLEIAPMDPASADPNPKKQYGLASIPLHMWSNLASAYGALGLYNGSLKYGTANFANTKVEASIYIAAVKRHLAAWEAGEEFDPADGVPNLGGCLANIAILLEARAAGTLIDDRALMSGYLKERDTLKALLPRLHEVHAGKSPKHYTIGG